MASIDDIKPHLRLHGRFMMSITPAEVGSFFLTLIVPIMTGVAAAGFTAYFALNRFYREKWWEKKHAAYNQLIDNLLEIKSIYNHAYNIGDRSYQAAMQDRVIPEETADWGRLYELNAQLHRFYVLAPISLSSSTRQLLSNFFKKTADSEYSVYEEGIPDFLAYGERASFAQNLIDSIVKDAEFELKFK